MKSIGNDIVALGQIDEQRSITPSFYKKFVTAGELKLHPAVMLFPQFIWLLWAVKESAYKYLKRSEADLLFSPTKIIIKSLSGLDDEFNGVVEIQNSQLYFLVNTTSKYISAIVNDTSNFDQVTWHIHKVDNANNDTRSEAVRYFALKTINSTDPETEHRIIKTDAGYPIILKNGVASNILLSFAHHGNYVSYAFLNDDNSDI